MSLTASCEKVFFLISPADDLQLERLNRMEKNGLFQIIVYDYKYLANGDTTSLICSGLKNYFLQLLSASGCDINTVNEIFVSSSGAYCPFELFLVLMKIPYSLVEFSKNEFSDRLLVKSINQYEEISQAYCDLVFSAKTITGANDCCRKHIYYSGSELDQALPGKIAFFDPVTLGNLPRKTKESIIASYPKTTIGDFGEISTLLVPNSESLTRRALAACRNYINDIIAPYTLLVDLLEIDSKRLRIKPHPHGSFSFAKRFPSSILLDKTFPIEFLQLFPNCKIKRLLSIETSAVAKVGNLVENSVVASRYWMLRLKDILPLYTTLLLEKRLLNYKILHFYRDPEGINEIAQTLSRHWVHGRFRIESQFSELGPSELVVTQDYESAARFGSHIHKYIISQKNTLDMPVFLDSSSSLYIAGEIGSAECKEAELSFSLRHSGVTAFLRYEGKCKVD